MEEVRRLKPDEYAAAVLLADQIFRDEETSSMAIAFPYSFSSALGQSFGAFEDGKLASFMGLVPALIQIGPAQLNTFLLGQVCTDRDARNKGYASKVLAAVLQHIDHAGASIMLVSGARSLYERSGCLRFGEMHHIEVDLAWGNNRLRNRGNPALIREQAGHDWFELKRLADAREVRFPYSLWDLAALIEAESKASCKKHEHRVLVAEDAGELKGFLVYTVPQTGKSTEHKPEAVEWSGEPDVVVDLIAQAICKHSFDSFHLTVPAHEQSLRERFDGGIVKQVRYPSTIHVVNPLRLMKQIEPYFLSKGCKLPANLHLEKEEEHRVAIRIEGEESKLSAQQFIDWMFTPTAENQPRPVVNGWMDQACLPVPLPSPQGLLYV